MTEVEDLLATVTRLLHARGEKMSAPRRAVIRALAHQGGHLSADAVVEAVGVIDASVHRASVYRTLAALSDADVVHHVHEGHGTTVYHLRTGPHLHAQCTRCGDLIDVRPDLVDDVATALHAEYGFALDAEHVALSGTCNQCAGHTPHHPTQHPE